MSYICYKCKSETENVFHFKDHDDISICDVCREKQEKESEYENEQWRKDDIICPACGHVFYDSWEYNDQLENEEEYEIECTSCDEKFLVTMIREIHYTSKRILQEDK